MKRDAPIRILYCENNVDGTVGEQRLHTIVGGRKLGKRCLFLADQVRPHVFVEATICRTAAQDVQDRKSVV